jgi:hypothetical protein
MIMWLFFSSPGPKGQVSYCHHLASVVVRRKLFQRSSPLGHPTIWKIKIKHAVSTLFMTGCLPEFLPSSLSNMYHNTSNSRTFDPSKLQTKSRTMQCKGQQHFICLEKTTSMWNIHSIDFYSSELTLWKESL